MRRGSVVADNSCSSTHVGINGFFHFCLLYKGFAQLICETMIAMYYPESLHEKRDYKWQPAPHYHNQCRGALESQTGAETQQNRTKTRTIQPTSAILILKCLLFLSVCLIRLHIGKSGCYGNGSGGGNQSHLWCSRLWQGQPQTKPWKSGASKLPISLIKCDIVFSQQSAHHCCTSHQLFLRLIQPACLWRSAVCPLPFFTASSLISLNSVTAS